MPTVTLTIDLAIWFLHGIHRLILMIICAIQFSNPTMHNEVMDRTRIWNTHTHTHTQRVNSICPSAILWRGHKNPVFGAVCEQVGLLSTDLHCACFVKAFN